MTRLGLKLSPLDPLLFRDGRPFGQGGHARSEMPTPQALAGALRTRILREIGFDFDRLAADARQVRDVETALKMSGAPQWFLDMRIRGPWLARASGVGLSPLIPLPASCIADGRGGYPCLRPMSPGLSLPGWLPPRPGMRPLWRSAEVAKGGGGYVPLDRLPACFAGELRAGDVVRPADLFEYDDRTGIGIQPGGLVAEEGLIYSVKLLSLDKDVHFYAELDVPSGAPDGLLNRTDTVAWGGESRHAAIKTVTPPVRWPSVPPIEGRATLVLTSPAVFRDGWAPDRLPEGARLVGAAVPDPLPISGWDLARGGPKPLRHAVPAGAVYFLEDCQVEALSPLDSLCGDAEDVRQGWGTFVYGGWSHA